MEQLIDIHCHILPAVDNGSVSMEQTRNMLKIAYEEGITYIIATPHYGAGCINPDKSELEEKLRNYRASAQRKGSHLSRYQVLSGQVLQRRRV